MDWKVNSLKFVNEMYNGLCHFFGVSAEETTEAELHQKLIEAGTIENIRAAATKEANDAVAAQMADFQTKLDALTSQVEGLQADATEKAAKVGELETELETVKGQLTDKDGEIAAHLEQVKSLSGTVAFLKAGKPLDKDTPPDVSKPIEQAKAPEGGVVVLSSELEAAYDRVRKMN